MSAGREDWSRMRVTVTDAQGTVFSAMDLSPTAAEALGEMLADVRLYGVRDRADVDGPEVDEVYGFVRDVRTACMNVCGANESRARKAQAEEDAL